MAGCFGDSMAAAINLSVDEGARCLSSSVGCYYGAVEISQRLGGILLERRTKLLKKLMGNGIQAAFLGGSRMPLSREQAGVDNTTFRDTEHPTPERVCISLSSQYPYKIWIVAHIKPLRSPRSVELD
jgi:hypothetical protein